ncbi:hypothetical protein FOPG_16444 [Fusarium oxysporum f. sp. conglutinans race 2 54008]|uniref:Uncharacterized protein n=2 Tax=Fusarium oxysporum f. sp. conglutinans TaxID=100902 RepID=F9FWF9_FUSOF|nr:hypothetical protein FOXB_10741 [Fusarium oxysporum f. sp. conglutinans Fo5176]EXL67446.1 hypothetical protein FOPG_16444 [Fusarium oxysporum f. sp. conglutinans race 2 54008]
MDTVTEEIARALGVDPKQRRPYCLGKNPEAFEAEVDGTRGFDAVQHEIWRRKAPLGKLHNLVHWILRSDKLISRAARTATMTCTG